MTAPLPIGAAVLDVAARTLAGPDRQVRLPDQAVSLLVRLAARPGEVLPWDAAVDALYGGPVSNARDPLMVARARAGTVRAALRETGAGAELVTVWGEGLFLRVVDEAGETPREAA